MATIYRGLNVGKSLIDVDEPREALKNLGLNGEDLNLIYGLTGDTVGLNTSDIHNVAGLVDDQERILIGQQISSLEITNRLFGLDDIRVSIGANFNINSTLHGGAIKYSYIDFNTATWATKNADISTSRVSSWSPVGPDATPDDYIIYGGDVKVQGQYLSASQMTTTTEPIAKQFRAEVATHVLKMNVNGVQEKFLVMKGIPLTFDCSFKTATLKANAIALQDGGSGPVPMVWKITNKDKPGGPFVRQLLPSTSAPAYSFRDRTYSKARKVEFFYNPANITVLSMPRISMEQWTNVSLPALVDLNLSVNSLPFIPNFTTLAPALTTLDISQNPLYLADKFLASGLTSSNTQLNSLPTGMVSIKASGCFTDSGVIDLRTKTSLETLILSSSVGSNIYRKFTSIGHSPKVVDPMTRLIVDLSDANKCDTNNGRIAIADHGLSQGNFVKYDSHVSSSNTLGTGSGLDAGTELVTGTWTGVGTTGTVYEVGTVTDDYFLLRTAIGSGSDITGFSAQPTGDIHSFTKCDQNGNTIFNDSVGIVNYNIFNQSYKLLDNSVVNSSKLSSLNTNSTPINSSADFPYFDNTSSATIGKSNEDRKIGTFRSPNLVSYSSFYNTNDIVNFSGKANLQSISIRGHSVDDKYGLSEKTLTGKFDNLDSLKIFTIYSLSNTFGNIKTGGYAQNKPVLAEFALSAIGGNVDDYRSTNGSLRDDFFSGSPLITNISISNSALIGRTTNDFLAVSGLANHQGKTFVNKDVLSIINISYLYSSALRFINDDAVAGGGNRVEFDLKQCNKLTQVKIRNMQMYGDMLDLTGVNSVTHYFINGGKRSVDLRQAKPGVTYKIVGSPTLSGADTQTWKDIGWVEGGGGTGQYNADVVPWGTTTAHLADPQVGDYFKATAITDSQIRSGKRYIVLETGTGTDWDSVGAGSSGFEGTVFTATQAYSAASGTGKVMPVAGISGVVESIGLSGQVPALDMPKLKYFYGYTNSFIGQFPVLNTPLLSSMNFKDNQLSGNIPDLRSTVNATNKSVRKIDLGNNYITGYEEGTLSTLTWLNYLDLSGNNLNRSISAQLIFDLFENFTARTRRNVQIKLSNQGGDEPLNELAIQQDGTAPLQENSSYNKLLAMREGGWIILLD